MSKQSRLVAVLSDLHIGALDGIWRSNPTLGSKWCLECWDDWWQWADKIRGKRKLVGIWNGDLIEGAHHGTVDIITPNLTEQAKECIKLIESVKHRFSSMYFIRGTESHTRDYEEMIRMAVGGRTPTQAPWQGADEMLLKVNDVFIHAQHHIGTATPFTDPYAPWRQILATYIEYTKAGWQIPDVFVRGHRHRFSMVTDDSYRTAVTNPSWKMADRYTHKVANQGLVPQVGGILIEVEPEGNNYTVHPRIYKPSNLQQIVEEV